MRALRFNGCPPRLRRRAGGRRGVAGAEYGREFNTEELHSRNIYREKKFTNSILAQMFWFGKMISCPLPRMGISRFTKSIIIKTSDIW
jgi:hypothetical protein